MNHIEKKTTKPETLCFKCSNACGGCSWSKDFVPVEGWTARPTRIEMGKTEKIVESFHVTACPLFRADEPRHVTKIHDETFKPFLYAMLNRMIHDYAVAIIRYEANRNDESLHEHKQTMNEIERFVVSPMFEDIVGVLELCVSGPKLLKLIRDDPYGTIDRLKSTTEFKRNTYGKDMNYAD